MKAKCYVDFSVVGDDADNPQYAVLSRIYRVIHGVFGGSNGSYAVAFPKAKTGKARSVGNVIRVFASSVSDIYALLEKIRTHHVLRDYARISMPQDVPDNFAGEWVSWQRIRVQKRAGINREATIIRATKSPYFDILSSSGHGFALRVCKVKSPPQTDDFIPNSYGLSVNGNRKGDGQNIFALPVIE